MLSRLIDRARRLSLRQCDQASLARIFHDIRHIESLHPTIQAHLTRRLMVALLEKPLGSPADFILCTVAARHVVATPPALADPTTHAFLSYLCAGLPHVANQLTVEQFAHFAELRHACSSALRRQPASTASTQGLHRALHAARGTLWESFRHRLDESTVFRVPCRDLTALFRDEPFPDQLVSPGTTQRTITGFLSSASALLAAAAATDGVEDVRVMFLLCVAMFREGLVRHSSGAGLSGDDFGLFQRQTTYFTAAMRDGKRHGVVSLTDIHFCFRMLRKVVDRHLAGEAALGSQLLSRKAVRNMWHIVFGISKKQKPVPPACVVGLAQITRTYLGTLRQKDVCGILGVLADRYPGTPGSVSGQFFTRYVSFFRDSPPLCASSGSVAEIQGALKEMCSALKAWHVLRLKSHDEREFLQKRLFKSLMNLSGARNVRLSGILDIEIIDSVLLLIWKTPNGKDGERLLAVVSHAALSVLGRSDVSWVFRCVNSLARIFQTKKPNRAVFAGVCAVMPRNIPQATHSQLISLSLFITRAAPRGNAQSLSGPIFQRLDEHFHTLLSDQVDTLQTISTHDLAVWLRFICAQNHDAPDSTVFSLLSIISSSTEATRDPFICVSLLYYISRYHSQMIHDTFMRDPMWMTSALYSKNEVTSASDRIMRSLAQCLDNMEHYVPKLSPTQSVFLLKSLAALPAVLSPHMDRVMDHLCQGATQKHSWNSAAILLKLMAHRHLSPRSYAVSVLDNLCHEGFHGASLRNLCDIYMVVPMMRIRPVRLHREIWIHFVNKMADASSRQVAVMLEARALYRKMNLAHILTADERAVSTEPELIAAILATCRSKIPEMTPEELVIAGGSLVSLEIDPADVIFQDCATALFLSAGEKAFAGASLTPVRIANFFQMLIFCIHSHWKRGESPAPEKELSRRSPTANHRKKKSVKKHDIARVNHGILRALGQSADFLWLRVCSAGTMMGCLREIVERFGDELHAARFRKQMANWKVIFVAFGPFIKSLVTMDEIFRDNLASLKDYLILPLKKREASEDPVLRLLASHIEPEHVLSLVKHTLWLVEKDSTSTIDSEVVDGETGTESMLHGLLPPFSQKDLLVACAFLLKVLHCVCHRIPVKLVERVHAFVKAIPFSRLDGSKTLVLTSLNAFYTEK